MESNTVESNIPIDIEEEEEDLELEEMNVENENVNKSVAVSTSLTRKCKRKERSKVWTSFRRISVTKDGKERCKCKGCGKIFSCTSTG